MDLRHHYLLDSCDAHDNKTTFVWSKNSKLFKPQNLSHGYSIGFSGKFGSASGKKRNIPSGFRTIWETH